MTEPVARHVARYVDHVYLATDIPITESIFDSYDKLYKYSLGTDKKIKCDLTIQLSYERSESQKSYIQGFFESAGFNNVKDRSVPQIKNEWKRIIEDDYILIAPFTSKWEERKRNWGYKNFKQLTNKIRKELGVKCVILDSGYTLKEMISLIRHCKLFIGNDSGPGIIAQSFNKKSLIIFGATHPRYLHLSKYAIPIFDKHRHKLCKHKTRQEEIDCCEEFCMDRISVDHVFKKILEVHDGK